MPTSNLLAVLKDTVEFLQASEVAQTSVGIQAYIQGCNQSSLVMQIVTDSLASVSCIETRRL